MVFFEETITPLDSRRPRCWRRRANGGPHGLVVPQQGGGRAWKFFRTAPVFSYAWRQSCVYHWGELEVRTGQREARPTLAIWAAFVMLLGVAGCAREEEPAPPPAPPPPAAPPAP